MKMKEIHEERIVGHELDFDDEEIDQGHLKVKKVIYPKLFVKKLL